MNKILRITSTTALTTGILTIILLGAVSAGFANPTVFQNVSSDFNSAANWNDGMPGANGSFNAVIQSGHTATTTDDYTNADGDPITNNWNLVPRYGATVNINHNLETAATGGANAGNIWFATSGTTDNGTINQAAGTTVTSGGVILGFAGQTDNNTLYDLDGTLDATTITVRDGAELRVGATGSSGAAITIESSQQGSIRTTGEGGTLSGAITLSSSADFRGEGNALTFSGGINSAANENLSLNLQAIINSNPIDLNAGVMGFTSAGNNPASAAELNVAGNDWGLTRINFGGYVELGVNDAMPTDTDIEFGWSDPGQHSGTLDLGGYNQTVASIATRSTALGELDSSVNLQEITGGGTLTVNQSGNTEFQGTVSDGGTATALTKSGAGTLTLNNTTGVDSDYSGATTISAGRIQVGSSSSLSSNSAHTVAALAFLELDGNDSSIGSLAGAGTVENASGTAATLTTGDDDTSPNFSGLLQDGTGGGALALTKIGTGTQTLNSTAANTYTGGTTIDGGMVSLGSGGHQDALGTGAVTVNSDGELQLWISNTGTYTIDNNFTLDGGTVHSEDGQYNLTGTMSLGAGGGTLSGKWYNKYLHVSGAISGAGDLTVDDKATSQGGDVILSGNNSYGGDTTVEEGTLEITANQATTSGDIVVNDGGTYSVNSGAYNAFSATTEITINDGGTVETVSAGLNAHNLLTPLYLNGGTLTSSGNSYSEGNWIFNDDVIVAGSTLSTISGLGVGSKNGGGTYNVADSVADTNLLVSAPMVDAAGGSYLTKEGAGTMALTAANTYTGETTVNGGTLVLHAPSSYYDYRGGQININNNGSVLRVQNTYFFQNDTFVFGSNGGGNLDIGLGNNVFRGNNTFTTLGGSQDTITGTYLNCDTFGTRTFNVANGSDDVDLLISADISNNGSVEKTGAGVMAFTTDQTYFGGTTVSGGELHLESGDNTLAANSPLTIDGASSVVRLGPTVLGNNIFGSGALTIQNGGTLTDDTTEGRVHSINNGLTFNNGGTLTAGGTGYNGSYGNYYITTDVDVTGNAAATISADAISLAWASVDITVAEVTGDASADLTISSIIQNWGGVNPSYLNKAGAGTLTLTGNSTYTGGTTVNAGELHLESGDATLAANSPLTIDGASSVVRLGPTVDGNNIFGSGALTIQNGGTLTDDTSGDMVHSINNGLTFTDGGTLTSIGGSPSGSFGNYFISGSGNIVVSGNAAATISADNISINGAKIFSVADVTAGTDLTVSSVIQNWGANAVQVNKSGAGTMEMTGNSTYTDGTTVSAGTLLANNSSGSGTGSGAVAVNATATLGGTGSVDGHVTVASTGHIAPGSGGIGTLALAGGLTLNNGSILDIEADVGGTCDKIVVSGGDFTGATSDDGVTVNVTMSGVMAGAVTYTLMEWSSPDGVEIDDFDLVYTGSGGGALSIDGNTLLLTASIRGALFKFR